MDGFFVAKLKKFANGEKTAEENESPEDLEKRIKEKEILKKKRLNQKKKNQKKTKKVKVEGKGEKKKVAIVDKSDEPRVPLTPE